MECVINISEGKNVPALSELANAAGDGLLDVHSDSYHNRSVFTLYGSKVYECAISLTERAFDLLDIAIHEGVHPRMGVVDVVPFVPIAGATIADAMRARQRYASEISATFSVPVFLYGPERTLPQIRREAFKELLPDFGPPEPHPRFGSLCVGVRDLLVAYNLYLVKPDLGTAKKIANMVRGQYFRVLGLKVGDEVQISANLIDPLNHGIYEFYRAVSKHVEVSRGELVGLAPLQIVQEVPKELWTVLDLSLEQTIEFRTRSKDLGPPDRRAQKN